MARMGKTSCRTGRMAKGLWRVALAVMVATSAWGQEELKTEELKTEELVELSLDELLNTTVVTASRTETPLSKVTKSISVVNRRDMDTAQELFVPEMIDTVPGVFLKRNGGPGRLVRINIRGAESQYTQFQYNGLPLKDAADTQNTFHSFLQDLYLGSGIDRVEVLRGTNSTLYGSQAMGGVINIIPDKWMDGPELLSRTEVGDNDRILQSARAGYGTDAFFLDLNPLYITTDNRDGFDGGSYEYEKTGFLGGAGVKLAGESTLEFSSIFSDSEAPLNAILPGIDAGGGLIRNQPAEDQEYQNQLYQLGLVYRHKTGDLWDFTVKGAYSETERTYSWSDTSGDRSDFDGDTAYGEFQFNLHPKEWITVTLGADYEQSGYDNTEPLDKYAGVFDPVTFSYDWDFWDLFAMAQTRFLDDALLIDVGGRYNDHEKFDAKAVWEMSAAYIFQDIGTKLHSHIGTGYRAPALYEVHGGFLSGGVLIPIGNPDLSPEESVSYEAGVDQFLLENKLNLGVTYFRIDFDDLVVYDLMANRYENAAEAKTEGIESYVHYQPISAIRVGVNYTHADPKTKGEAGGKWVRKDHFPRNKVSATFQAFFLDKAASLYLRANWIDEKIVPLYDAAFTQVQWKEDAVTTVDAAFTYRFAGHMEAWLKADNITGETYTEGGYLMPDRWISGGLKVYF